MVLWVETTISDSSCLPFVTLHTKFKMEELSTKQKLLCLIDDVEIITKELLELMSTARSQQKPDAPDSVKLLELLVQKDKEIKNELKVAGEQAEIYKTYEAMKLEVEKRDVEIKNLQKNLKEAETILSTAIYQARQKLDAIEKANNKKISSEELIKFAHRISASNAVAAPPTWAPGDPRRPYPTDFEMRHGFLGKQSDLPMNSQVVQTQGTYGEPMSSNRSTAQVSDTGGSTPQSASTPWQPPPELPISLNTSGSAHNTSSDSRGNNKENEDVEYMSSDSSSTSSSDE